MGQSMPKQNVRSISGFFIKLGISCVALYYVFSSIDLTQAWEHITRLDWYYLVFALLILNSGQLVSAMRLRYYFASAGVRLRAAFVIPLYYVGMFFNRFLPGAVGGDGYIVLYARKHFKLTLPVSIRLLVSCRANGLLALFLWAYVLSYLAGIHTELSISAFSIAAIMLAIIVFYSYLAKHVLKEPIAVQLGALRYSLYVQGSCAAVAAIIFHSIHTTDPILLNLSLFMISSAMTMLPISVGGAGVREVTFLVGAQYLGISAEPGVIVSLIFFFLDLISSLLGAFFWHRLGKIDAIEKTSAPPQKVS